MFGIVLNEKNWDREEENPPVEENQRKVMLAMGPGLCSKLFPGLTEISIYTILFYFLAGISCSPNNILTNKMAL